jgi:hypothetical protein
VNLRRGAQWGLVGLGCLAMLGHFTQILPIKGIGVASVASPLPLVFSDVRGFETFAATFTARIVFENGEQLEREVTPRIYSLLDGPYNRRNVYGAAISYGPRLPESVWKSILSYGVCNGGPIARLAESRGFPPDIAEAYVHIKSNTRGREKDEWELAVACK